MSFNDHQGDLFSVSREGDPEVLIKELETAAARCTSCRYHKNRKKSVFSSGSLDARIMLVAEGPGRNENEKGIPFVGPAGEVLDAILGKLSLKRAHLYICNAVKCWTGEGNPSPSMTCIKTCRHFLVDQIQLVKPAVIVACGNYSLKALFGESFGGIVKETGNVRYYGSTPVVPVIHPAAFLRPKEPTIEKAWKTATMAAWIKAKEIAYEQ